LRDFPVVDVRVELADAKYHDVDSSPLAFEIATRAAFREGLQKAKSVLLEPIMRIEVATPENIVDSIIKDLRSRRGHISGQQTRDSANVVNATAPLIAMFGYDDALFKMSQGRATFSMQFDHYAPALPSSGNDPPFRPAIGMRA
jgi:translation elongation factor EF-G